MNQDEKKLVSVIIPTYKRSAKLSRAVRSVLNQTYSNVEVLVVSDNEPDDEFTLEACNMVDSFHDSRVRLVTQEHHKNGAAARNAGIKASKGDYVAFLDDDDFWDKEKLELQVPILNSLDESWGGVSCKNKIFKGGKLTHLQLGYKDGYLYKKILLRMLEVSTDTILLRKNCLVETGMFDETLLRHQEVQMLAFFSHKYKIKLLDRYLCNVDIDDNQNRPNPEKLKKIKKDFLKAVEPITNTMSFYHRYTMKLIHRFEVGGVYYLSGDKWHGFTHSVSVLLSPTAMYVAARRIFRRMKSHSLPEEFHNKTINDYLKQNDLV